MNISLQQMSAPDYQSFLAIAIPDFAKNKALTGDWKSDEALEKSKNAFKSLLPEGLETKDHYLKNILLDGEKTGFVWFAIEEEYGLKYAFLYEIYIFPENRNKGYGRKAMQLFMDEVHQSGAEKVYLHVFGHNHGALKLYQTLGFQINDYTMSYKI